MAIAALTWNTELSATSRRSTDSKRPALPDRAAGPRSGANHRARLQKRHRNSHRRPFSALTRHQLASGLTSRTGVRNPDCGSQAIALPGLLYAQDPASLNPPSAVRDGAVEGIGIDEYRGEVKAFLDRPSGGAAAPVYEESAFAYSDGFLVLEEDEEPEEPDVVLSGAQAVLSASPSFLQFQEGVHEQDVAVTVRATGSGSMTITSLSLEKTLPNAGDSGPASEGPNLPVPAGESG